MKRWSAYLPYFSAVLIALVFVFLFLGKPPSGESGFNVGNSYTDLRMSVYLVEVPLPPEVAKVSGQRFLGSGSGVMIAPHRMLTSGHVAEGSSNATLIVLNGKQELTAHVIKVSKDPDLALLEVDLDCPCAKLADQVPMFDTPALIIGYPMSEWLHIQVLTEGEIQGMTPNGLLLTNIEVAPGNSGGALFAWTGGEWKLVGIVKAFVVTPGFPPQALTYLSASVPIEKIRRFL